MKVSELKFGTKILVPCPRCGAKKHHKFTYLSNYKLVKNSLCRLCVCADKLERGDLAGLPNWKIGNTPSDIMRD